MDQNQEENQLETLQRLGHIGIWEFNLITQTLNWSNEIFNIFEVDKNSFNPTYEDFFKVVHPEDREILEEIYQNSLKTKEKFKTIHRLLMPDGRIKYVEQAGDTIFDDNNNPLISIGTVQDITEITLLRIETQNEQNKLKAILENIPDLVWMKDSNGLYVSCNKRFEDLYGYKEKEILGKSDYDFVDKNTADFFRKNDKNAMNSNKPISNFELLTFKNDGHQEYTKTIKTKVIDNDGNIIGVLGIGRDFTIEQENKEKLEFQKQELQTIFDTTKDGIAIIDLETNFKKVNKAYCDITGLSEEELLSTSCLALTIPEDVEGTIAKMKVLFEKGYVDSYEKRCSIKGKNITVSLSVTLLPDKEHMLISMKDVTQHKIFEEQSKLIAMGEMIGNIAHQWRQPLSVISSISTGLKMKSEFDNLNGYDIVPDMDVITKQVQYLSKTIDDFRNFISNNQSEQYFSIKMALEKTISILNSAMINNHINLILNIVDDMTLYGFENELMQALINIINNARDAIKDNVFYDSDKLIFIETKKIDNGLEISIKDSGGGIPENIIHRIFEPYFTTKHQSVGTGIGLSMTHKVIIERLNGNILVENQEYEYNGKQYKGACFRIVFKND